METQNRIFISLNTKNAIAPYYSYPLAMGYDLFAYDSYDSHRIRIFLTNHSATDYNIKHGERIAILNIIPMQSPTISIQQQLTETENHQHQHQDQEIR